MKNKIGKIKSVGEIFCIMNDDVFEEHEEIRAGVVAILIEIASGLDQTEDTEEMKAHLNKLQVIHHFLDFDDGSGSQTM